MFKIDEGAFDHMQVRMNRLEDLARDAGQEAGELQQENMRLENQLRETLADVDHLEALRRRVEERVDEVCKENDRLLNDKKKSQLEFERLAKKCEAVNHHLTLSQRDQIEQNDFVKSLKLELRHVKNIRKRYRSERNEARYQAHRLRVQQKLLSNAIKAASTINPTRVHPYARVVRVLRSASNDMPPPVPPLLSLPAPISPPHQPMPASRGSIPNPLPPLPSHIQNPLLQQSFSPPSDPRHFVRRSPRSFTSV